MSTLDPKPEATPASDVTSAEGKQKSQSTMEGVTRDKVDADRQIVERCLAGDQRAWERLYRRCHPRLRKAIELLLGVDAADGHLIEEIAARVWYALLQDNCRLLAAYDAERDSPLDVFLMGLARIEILRHTRSERRRHLHELLRGRKTLEEDRVSDWQLASMMDEFLATLTPNERTFLHRFLTSPTDPDDDPEDPDMSSTTIWQRRRRIRCKLDQFLRRF